LILLDRLVAKNPFFYEVVFYESSLELNSIWRDGIQLDTKASDSFAWFLANP
jgi:hypothetical protein